MLPNKESLPKLTWRRIDHCFGCGRNNPVGLKLQFHFDSDKAQAEFTPSEVHQGWQGIVHGGIIYALLDEAMSWALYPLGMSCLTAECQVRFKHPAPVGKSLFLTGRVTKQTRKLVRTAATITSEDGTLIAEGTALMFVADRQDVPPEEISPSLPFSENVKALKQ